MPSHAAICIIYIYIYIYSLWFAGFIDLKLYSRVARAPTPFKSVIRGNVRMHAYTLVA